MCYYYQPWRGISFTVCFFVSFFCQRFLDNPLADSSQILHAGVLWSRMCLLPFWGLAAPGGRKRGEWNFRYNRSQWGIFAFWRFLSDISATRGRIHTKFYLCAPSLCGVHRPLRAGDGELKTQKNGGWSHSCCGQLPFLFFSALPDVVQYVGHRLAHSLM